MNVCMYGGGLGQFADIRVGEGGGGVFGRRLIPQ